MALRDPLGIYVHRGTVCDVTVGIPLLAMRGVFPLWPLDKKHSFPSNFSALIFTIFLLLEAASNRQEPQKELRVLLDPNCKNGCGLACHVAVAAYGNFERYTSADSGP